MHQCPFCHGPIEGIPIDADLTAKQREIFLMIMNAGPAGINANIVRMAILNGRSPTTLRTHIYHINKAIHPLRIECHAKSGIYRFVVDKVMNSN